MRSVVPGTNLTAIRTSTSSRVPVVIESKNRSTSSAES